MQLSQAGILGENGMKKLLLLLSLTLALACPFAASAHAEFLQEIGDQLPPVTPLTGEHIDTLDNHITINQDGTITIEEQILYSFGELERHGIFRTLPLTRKNSEGTEYAMKVTVQSVSADDVPAQYTTSTEDNTLKIKIGDPNKTLTGQHIYGITYTIAGALNYFSDHDELYWNVIGPDWTVPIGRATAHIDSPYKSDVTTYQPVCYTGYPGSTESNCKLIEIGTNTVLVSNSFLNPGEAFTIVYGMKPNMVAKLEPEKVIPFWQTWYGQILILGLIVAAIAWYLVYPLWLIIKWFLYGRDPKSTVGVVSAWFDPPKDKTGRALTPGETGTLLDERADFADISGMLVSLAQRGYLIISEPKKDEFWLKRGAHYDDQHKLQSFEQTLLTGIFKKKEEVKIEDAKLYQTVENTKEQLYTKLVADGFFPKNPNSVRAFYTVMSALAVTTANVPLFISAALFGMHMATKTVQGAEAAAYARSLKNFLNSQERQFDFQGKEKMMFEKLLPYAVAFGVEDNWAKRFEKLNLPAPEWYQGYDSSFNSRVFVHHLSSSFHSVQDAAIPPSTTRSSSGFSSGFSGGSSGGGGGGGGGGSW